MKFFDRLLFAACAGAILLALSACSGESTDAADAKTTLSPGGVYTVSRVTLLAADPTPAQARRATASTEGTKENKGETAKEGEGEGEGEKEESEEKEEEPAAPPIAAGSSFTLSASPASSGFALSFSLPDGSSFSATASAPAVGEPSGSHRSYRAGDTIATFAVTGPVQGEITVRATATIEAVVNGGSVTNVSTNAVSPGASSTNGPAAVTNVSFSASSSSSVTPANSSLAAELTFPSFQLSATASGPSGTVSW